jgi:hypothetical protein
LAHVIKQSIVARMLVNRVWHYHFGQGLVSTIDNLGQSGADRFVRNCWTGLLPNSSHRAGLEALHRLILNSATWRAERRIRVNARFTNRSHHATARCRIAARAMLAVSGELDLKAADRTVPTKTDKQGQIIIDEKQAGAFAGRSIFSSAARTQ